MASVAAATAIVAVIATVVVTRNLTAGSHPAAGQTAEAIKAQVPPFFVAAVQTKAQPLFVADAVKVGRTATGQILATVRPPAPYTSFGAISAAADDRTFVLTAQRRPVVYPPNTNPGTGPARLYLLRLSPSRRRAVALTAVPKLPVFPRSVRVVGISLSPSGTRLAVELQPKNDFSTTYLRVYDLADGKFLAWSLPAGGPILRNYALSWVDGNRFLAILINTNRPANCRAGCVRLLDTTQGGSSFLAASKAIFAVARIHRLANWHSALVAADGSRIALAGLAGKRHGAVTIYDKPLLYVIATRSGKTLSRLTGRVGRGPYPAWVGAQGEPIITTAFRPKAGLIAAIYAGHRMIPLRLPAGTSNATW